SVNALSRPATNLAAGLFAGGAGAGTGAGPGGAGVARQREEARPALLAVSCGDLPRRRRCGPDLAGCRQCFPLWGAAGTGCRVGSARSAVATARALPAARGL